MNLTEAIVVIAIIGLALGIAATPTAFYPKDRLDAYLVASKVRECALLSFANDSCTVTGKLNQIGLSCSGGFQKTEKTAGVSDLKFTFQCSEGIVERPGSVQVGKWVVAVGRRSVEVHRVQEKK